MANKLVQEIQNRIVIRNLMGDEAYFASGGEGITKEDHDKYMLAIRREFKQLNRLKYYIGKIEAASTQEARETYFRAFEQEAADILKEGNSTLDNYFSRVKDITWPIEDSVENSLRNMAIPSSEALNYTSIGTGIGGLFKSPYQGRLGIASVATAFLSNILAKTNAPTSPIVKDGPESRAAIESYLTMTREYLQGRALEVEYVKDMLTQSERLRVSVPLIREMSRAPEQAIKELPEDVQEVYKEALEVVEEYENAEDIPKEVLEKYTLGASAKFKDFSDNMVAGLQTELELSKAREESLGEPVIRSLEEKIRQQKIKDARIRRETDAGFELAGIFLQQVNPKAAQILMFSFNSYRKIEHLKDQLGKKSIGALEMMTGYVGIVMGLASILSKNNGPTFEGQVMEALEGIQNMLVDIQKQIHQLAENMNDRFDEVVSNQNTIIVNLEDSLSTILREISASRAVSLTTLDSMKDKLGKFYDAYSDTERRDFNGETRDNIRNLMLLSEETNLDVRRLDKVRERMIYLANRVLDPSTILYGDIYTGDFSAQWDAENVLSELTDIPRIDLKIGVIPSALSRIYRDGGNALGENITTVPNIPNPIEWVKVSSALISASVSFPSVTQKLSRPRPIGFGNFIERVRKQGQDVELVIQRFLDKETIDKLFEQYEKELKELFDIAINETYEDVVSSMTRPYVKCPLKQGDYDLGKPELYAAEVGINPLEKLLGQETLKKAEDYIEMAIYDYENEDPRPVPEVPDEGPEREKWKQEIRDSYLNKYMEEFKKNNEVYNNIVSYLRYDPHVSVSRKDLPPTIPFKSKVHKFNGYHEAYGRAGLDKMKYNWGIDASMPLYAYFDRNIFKYTGRRYEMYFEKAFYLPNYDPIETSQLYGLTTHAEFGDRYRMKSYHTSHTRNRHTTTTHYGFGMSGSVYRIYFKDGQLKGQHISKPKEGMMYGQLRAEQASGDFYMSEKFGVIRGLRYVAGNPNVIGSGSPQNPALESTVDLLETVHNELHAHHNRKRDEVIRRVKGLINNSGTGPVIDNTRGDDDVEVENVLNERHNQRIERVKKSVNEVKALGKLISYASGLSALFNGAESEYATKLADTEFVPASEKSLVSLIDRVMQNPDKQMFPTEMINFFQRQPGEVEIKIDPQDARQFIKPYNLNEYLEREVNSIAREQSRSFYDVSFAEQRSEQYLFGLSKLVDTITAAEMIEENKSSQISPRGR